MTIYGHLQNIENYCLQNRKVRNIKTAKKKQSQINN